MAFARGHATKVEEEFMMQNLRQFGIVNNELAERCFCSCVGSAANRQLTTDESQCVESCAEKLISASMRVVFKAAEMNPMGIGGGEQSTVTASQLSQATPLSKS